MTAINVLVGTDRVHFFSDGGHFADNRLCHLGGKILHLPAYDAALAYSGPSVGALALLAEIERSPAPTLAALLNRLPGLVDVAHRKAGIGQHPFSAIVAGVERGLACGVAIEEGGAHHFLMPGSFIRSLATDVAFDPQDLVGSGLAMMEDQRRHGVVAGWCQRSVVGRDAFHSQILRRWPATLAGGAETTQAKIGTLQVNTINFADTSVTGVVTGTTTVNVPNAAGYPVILTGSCQYSYKIPGSTNGVIVAGTITRTSDGKVIAERSVGHAAPPTGSFGAVGFSMGGLDGDAPSGSVAYAFSVSLVGFGDPPGGSGSVSSHIFSGLYTKK